VRARAREGDEEERRAEEREEWGAERGRGEQRGARERRGEHLREGRGVSD